jgi:hypothetical protein
VFFDESITDQVQAVSPYSLPRSMPDGAPAGSRTLNATDGVYKSQSGSSCLLGLTPLGSSAADGYKATITLGVDPSATPAPVGGGGGHP